MAFVSGFETDVFISYPMEAEEWTSHFEKELKKELRSTLTSTNVEVYFANRNWTLGYSSKAMLDKARNSAIFLAVLTPASVSEAGSNRFLRDEVNAFRESGSVEGRFCPIPLKPFKGELLTKIMPPDDPDSFWNKNIEFFYKENGDETPHRLEPNSQPEPGAYKKQIEKLAWHLRKLLEKLEERQSAVAAGAKQGPFLGKTVLLAPGADLDRERQEILQLLKSDGVTILPGKSYSEDRDVASQEFLADLKKADLFVQLLSFENWEDDKRRFAIAQEQATPVMQWHQQLGKRVMEAFMNASEDAKSLFHGTDVFAGGLEEFKRALREKMQELNRPPEPSIQIHNKLIYIAADTPDLPVASQLQRAVPSANMDVMDREKSKRRKDFESALERASGVIFLHGASDSAFIDHWLKAYKREMAVSENFRPKWAKLYKAPPKKTIADETFVLPPNTDEVGSHDELQLDAMKEIYAELARDRG